MRKFAALHYISRMSLQDMMSDVGLMQIPLDDVKEADKFRLLCITEFDKLLDAKNKKRPI